MKTEEGLDLTGEAEIPALWTFFVNIVLALALALLFTGLTMVVCCVGWVLSKIFPLTVFQGSLIFIATGILFELVNYVSKTRDKPILDDDVVDFMLEAKAKPHGKSRSAKRA